jgi:hypothetical protein
MKKLLLVLLVVVIASFLLVGCLPTTPDYNPEINPLNFTDQIDNPYFSLTPGTTFSYQSKTDEGTEVIKVIVTDQTKQVMGVTTLVVWDRVWLDDELIEETYDWYAQDQEGNVWYFGEDSKEYENGEVVSTEGSWESGVDGALPGIIMKSNPTVGDSYRQEYYQGEAEDWAEVVSLNEKVVVPYASFENCIKTKDWSALEPNVIEYKYYSPSVKNVVLETDADNITRVELIKIEK